MISRPVTRPRASSGGSVGWRRRPAPVRGRSTRSAMRAEPSTSGSPQSPGASDSATSPPKMSSASSTRWRRPVGAAARPSGSRAVWARRSQSPRAAARCRGTWPGWRRCPKPQLRLSGGHSLTEAKKLLAAAEGRRLEGLCHGNDAGSTARWADRTSVG